MERVTFGLQPELLDQLKAYAKRKKLSMSEVCRRALGDFLNGKTLDDGDLFDLPVRRSPLRPKLKLSYPVVKNRRSSVYQDWELRHVTERELDEMWA